MLTFTLGFYQGKKNGHKPTTPLCLCFRTFWVEERWIWHWCSHRFGIVMLGPKLFINTHFMHICSERDEWDIPLAKKEKEIQMNDCKLSSWKDRKKRDSSRSQRLKAHSYLVIPVSEISRHVGLLEINRGSPVCRSESTEQRAAQSPGTQIIFM